MSVSIATLDAVLKNFGDRLTIIEERHMSGAFAENLTIRDQFAMAALSNASLPAMDAQRRAGDTIAKECYMIADAMLAERAKNTSAKT